MASATSPPFRPPFSTPRGSKSSPYAGGTASSSTTTSLNPFTSSMRDRQARGKDPYRGGDDSDDDYSDGDDRPAKMRLGTAGSRGLEREDFNRLEKRQYAIAFLENPEMLMMYAQSTGDSIPGARLYFTRMLCGYEKPESSGKAKGAAGVGMPFGGGGRSSKAGGQGQQSHHGGGSGSGGGGKGSSARKEGRARG